MRTLKHPARLAAGFLFAAVAVAFIPRVAAASAKPSSMPLTLETVVPFFEGSADAEQLRPLRTWIARRVADGAGRRAESEIRDALKKIRRQREDNLQHPYDLAGSLLVERARLRGGFLSRQAGLRETAQRYAKLAPVPSMEDLFPTITGIAIASEEGAGLTAADSGADGAAPVEPRNSDSIATDPDMRELMDRLESDITTLKQMMDAAERTDDAEEVRLQRALKALPAFIKSAATTTAPASTGAKSARP